MSSRRARVRRRHKSGAIKYVAAGAAGVFALVIAILLTGSVSAAAVVSGWLEDLPDYESPEAFEVAQATRIYSADGVLLAKLYLENRTVVPISQISTDLAHAVVAVEDERFYEHDGVDIPGVARAAVVNFMTGTLDEGASTITQQYIDNTLLLDERLQRDFRYKAREAYLARELEKRKTKDEILELYLNAIYFGEGAYGAQAAAKTFFAKDAKDLTVPEAALLAGLPQAPSGHNPWDNPERAMKRRDEVLRHMHEQGYIDQAQYDEALATPLELKRTDEPEDGIYEAHYFVAHVKKVLQEEFSQSLVFQGGLDVYTTVDTRTQKMAEDAVFSSFKRSSDPDCALVSIDPRNGHVVALVGGEDYATNKFNLATQGKRQPGSSFKTFVLVTALEEGHPPHRYINGSSPAVIASNPKWTVYNGGGSSGYITLKSATQGSVNTAFARLIWELNDKKESGAEKVANTARRMGITSDIPPYPSIALGSQNVSPLEMASAYGTLANNGQHYPATVITKVVGPNGDVVFEEAPEPEQALTPEIAYATTTILEGVISGGTARRAAIGRPAAGKTGTSQDYRDAWFVGYTPQLATSVWVGYYEKEIPMRSVNGVRGFGGTLAAPVWAKFMKQALKDEPKLDFTKQKAPKYTWKKSWSKQAGTEKIPSLVGKTVTQAQAALKGTKFKLSVGQEYSSAAKGTIFSQSPAGGGTAKEGSTIRVKVSLGPKPATPAPAPTPEPEPEPEPEPTPDPSSTVEP